MSVRATCTTGASCVRPGPGPVGGGRNAGRTRAPGPTRVSTAPNPTRARAERKTSVVRAGRPHAHPGTPRSGRPGPPRPARLQRRPAPGKGHVLISLAPSPSAQPVPLDNLAELVRASGPRRSPRPSTAARCPNWCSASRRGWRRPAINKGDGVQPPNGRARLPPSLLFPARPGGSPSQARPDWEGEAPAEPARRRGSPGRLALPFGRLQHIPARDTNRRTQAVASLEP